MEHISGAEGGAPPKPEETPVKTEESKAEAQPNPPRSAANAGGGESKQRNPAEDDDEIFDDDAGDSEEEDEDMGEQERIELKDSDADETHKKLSKMEESRQMSLRQKQLERLKSLKQEQTEEQEEEDKNNAERRLDFLMQQAEVFAHFMSGEPETKKGKKQGDASAAAGTSHRAAHRMTEEAEDDILIKEALEDTQRVKLTKQPSIIVGGTMRDYQLEGLNWMINLHDNGISGILADEMGLGKTLQSISLLAYLKEYRGINGPHLVIVPKSTLGNWCNEFKRWCPTFKVLRLHGQKEERTRLVREELLSGQYEVVVTTYEVINIEKTYLKRFSWRYIVIDEAHRIKNEKSTLSHSIRQLDSQYRLLLTGTPLQNNLHELWALLNFLLPDVFSSSEDFDRWFDTGGGTMQEDIVRKLHTILKPFLLRRLKIDVETSLKPKIETKLYVGMSKLQRQWYRKLLSKDATALNQLGGADKVRLLNILMQLRKVCNHPYLFDGAEPGPPYEDGPHLWENAGKMALLDKLLPKLKAQGSRVLLFSQMTRLLDILEDYMRFKGYQYCRLDGQTKGLDREEAIDSFNAPDSEKFVFLLSTRAGGLGLNLATADIVVLYDSDWNPQMDLQAQDRAHRIGQKKQVRVFRFITENTVEEKIIERAEKKLYLDAVVIQQGRLMEKEKTLSKDELMMMVKFGADDVFRSNESTITDDDIDAILARGEARTKEDSEKLQRDMAHTLKNFTLDESLSDMSIYMYGGEDWSKKTQKAMEKQAAATFIDIGQRDRSKKARYNVNNYFREALGTSSAKKDGPVRLVRAPTMHDFQFFNAKRIEEIVDKENDLAKRRREHKDLLRMAQANERKERNREVRQRKEEHINNGMDEKEAAQKAQEEYKEAHPEAESVQLEAQLQELYLSEKEAKEKERLLAEGFGDWTKKDFRAFISACEKYGRKNLDAIVTEVSELMDKDPGEVESYYHTFWKRYKELNDWEKYLQKIEKGEQKLEKKQQVEKEIKEKLSRHEDPFASMPISYGATKDRGFTEDEDRFLLCMMHELGYGEWDALHREVRRADEFRFDWFMKSRTAVEIGRRCDTLVRLVEKENVDFRKKANRRKRRKSEVVAAAGKKRPSSGGGNAGKRTKV